MDKARQQRDADPDDHTTDEEIMRKILHSGRRYTKGIGPKIPTKILLHTRRDGASTSCATPTKEDPAHMVECLKKVISMVDKMAKYLNSIDSNFQYEAIDIEPSTDQPQHHLEDDEEENDHYA